MCTATFIPRPTGYCLAMNRDEQLTRVAGLPPVERIVNSRRVLCPSEPGGGTWIALNDGRVSFVLINWYSVTARVKDKAISRGEVVNSVSASTSFTDANTALLGLPLPRINPFRLIGVFPETREITEWRWNLKTLGREHHRWRPQQWISSGFDEPAAQHIRSKTFEQAQNQQLVGTLGWIRRLHASHSPEAGPFSTCMHRSDAATVSYTEISVTAAGITMRYQPIAPCVAGELRELTTRCHWKKLPSALEDSCRSFK